MVLEGSWHAGGVGRVPNVAAGRIRWVVDVLLLCSAGPGSRHGPGRQELALVSYADLDGIGSGSDLLPLSSLGRALAPALLAISSGHYQPDHDLRAAQCCHYAVSYACPAKRFCIYHALAPIA